MAFDADAWLEAITPPSFTYQGRTWRGRVLSLEEWMPFEPRARAVQTKGTAGYLGWRSFVRDLCDRVFPRPWWKIWERRVSYHVLRLPLAAQVEAIQDFLASQKRALELPGMSTNGSDSPRAGSGLPQESAEESAAGSPSDS